MLQYLSLLVALFYIIATGGGRGGANFCEDWLNLFLWSLSLGLDPPQGTLSLTPGATPATRAGVIPLQLDIISY